MGKIVWTPWRSHDELLAVRSQLYPPNHGEQLDMRSKACSRICAWRLRLKLPHAVESTWLLTEAVLADKEMGLNELSPLVVRGAYSTAFCRFVTGLTDTEQDGAVKSSMYDTAKQIGLPTSFVDLRHDAIHGDLPSLIVFREATRKALVWLWNYYWKYLAPGMGTDDECGMAASNDQREPFKEKVGRILRAYLSASQPQDSSLALELNNATCLRLVRVCKGEKLALAEVVNVLLEEDMLIPSSRPRGKTPDGIFPLWGGLLKQLAFHQGPFLNLLVQGLIAHIISPSLIDPKVDDRRETVTFWLLEIHISQEWSFARKRGKTNADDLLFICLQNPNAWTNRLASALANQPGRRRLNEIYGDRIAVAIATTAQVPPDDSEPPRAPEGHLADLLAYQRIWLETAGGLREEENGARSFTLPAGGWGKWGGEWTGKPFGTL